MIDAEIGVAPCMTTLQEREQAHTLMERTGFTFSTPNRLFIIFAQVYLMLGGIGLILDGALLSDTSYRPAFLHLFTVGFLLFMMYGLGGHMLPRFTGVPLSENRWVWIQMGFAHCGAIIYSSGYFLGWSALALSGAVFAWVGLLIFTWRVRQVLWSGK
jgi:hypothetical protein